MVNVSSPFAFITLMICIAVLMVVYIGSYETASPTPSLLGAVKNDDSIAIPMERYPESPWRTPSTLAARTITSTPFARFEIHKVRTESGEIIDDWLWTDERSHVNILVCRSIKLKYILIVLIHILPGSFEVRRQVFAVSPEEVWTQPTSIRYCGGAFQ